MSRSELETNFFSNSTLENKRKYKKQIYIYIETEKGKENCSQLYKKEGRKF